MSTCTCRYVNSVTYEHNTMLKTDIYGLACIFLFRTRRLLSLDCLYYHTFEYKYKYNYYHNKDGIMLGKCNWLMAVYLSAVFSACVTQLHLYVFYNSLNAHGGYSCLT